MDDVPNQASTAPPALPAPPREPGILRGRIAIADDFDEIPPEFDDYA